MGGKYCGPKKKMKSGESKGSRSRTEKKLPKAVRSSREEAIKRGKKRRVMQLYSEY